MKRVQTVSMAVAMAAFAYGAAVAQTTSSGSAAGSNGVTSGPASPSHRSTTLGSNGHTPATQHQSETIRNRGQQPGSSGQSNGAALGHPSGRQ